MKTQAPPLLLSPVSLSPSSPTSFIPSKHNRPPPRQGHTIDEADKMLKMGFAEENTEIQPAAIMQGPRRPPRCVLPWRPAPWPSPTTCGSRP